MTVRTRKGDSARWNAGWICILAIAVVATAPAFARGLVLYEHKNGPFYSRAVLWDSCDLTESNLRAYYRVLSQELRDNRSWTVEVFVDRDDAERELHGKLRTEGSYEWWLHLYEEFGRNLLPKAAIMSYGTNAVLRMRNEAGKCSEILLAGENFLRVRIDNIDFEILETYFHRLPPHAKSSPGDQAMVSIYVRASSFPNADQAEKFTLLMRKRLQQKRINVAIRTDSHFITDSAFPIMYRFEPDGTPPSHEEYEKSKRMFCFFDRGGVACR